MLNMAASLQKNSDPSRASASGHTPPAATPHLTFTRREIRRLARERGPQGQVISSFLRQRLLEVKLRFRGRGLFRSNQIDAAVKGYSELLPGEFEIINAVQAWANWRTIPRNLTGRLPARPVRVLDLCSGSGESTQVLATYAAPGSHITGLEIDGRFVQMAQQRQYLSREGQPQHVDFSIQDVLDPFLDSTGQAIAAESVDLVNVSGAVAVHFDAQSTARLAGACQQVIKPGGLALIDAGIEGSKPRVVRTCFESRGFKHLGQSKSSQLDLSRQLCFVRV